MERVLVIGARRRRQGVGHHAAKWFHEEGANVCAIVGTSRETSYLARDQLRARGIECRAYDDLKRGLQEEKPDIVAVCSPYALHREHLEAVAAVNAHCLCEKPMWWGPQPERGAVTLRLVDAFVDRSLYLDLMTQWPRTLDSYQRLHPELKGAPVERFDMGLGPSGTGPAMILDAGPHVLSMLAALVDHGTVRDPRVTPAARSQRELRLAFDYEHAAGRTAATCHLVTCEQQPRPAWYAINGRIAYRRVSLPAYSMRLVRADNDRGVDLPDPMRAHVNRFLTDVRSRRTPDRRRLVESITNLEILLDACSGARAEVDRRPASSADPLEQQTTA
ncbi:MAG: Gfo/Idh/MocA family oxidoreductase [Planctomycetota bacterium]|jgi:hypothetical protein